MDWISSLNQVSADVELSSPADAAVIVEAELAVGELPSELKALLERSNGISCRSFHLFPAYDRKRPQKTWESIQRANKPGSTHALGGDPDLLTRFLVFADIGGGFAAWDRTDGSIWFEELGGEDLRQTDLSLREFVETMVRNVE